MRYTTLEFAWHVVEAPGVAPEFAAPWIRSRLGAALRNIVCSTGLPTCEGCHRRAGCPYGVVWEPAPADGLPAALRTPPAPYVPDGWCVAEPVPLEPGHEFRARLRLFGPARGHIHALVAAAVDGGRFGFGDAPARYVRAELTEVVAFAADERDTQLVYARGVGFVEAARLPWTDLEGVYPSGSGPVRVQFVTPTQIRSRSGDALLGADPVALTDALRRRLEALSLVYENAPVSWPVDRMLADARAVRVVASDLHEVAFSHHGWRRGEHTLTGLVGDVVVDNVAPALFHLWSTAEVVNVGSRVTYGMGAVVVEEVG